MTDDEITEFLAEAVRVAIQKMIDADPSIMGFEIKAKGVFGIPDVELDLAIYRATETKGN